MARRGPADGTSCKPVIKLRLRSEAGTEGLTTANPILGEAVRRLNAGDPSGAEALCRQALAGQANLPEAHHLLGVISHRLGRGTEAITHLRRAVATGAVPPSWHVTLGEAHRDLGQFKKAIGCFRQALRRDPKLVEAQIGMALCLADAGKTGEAIKRLKKLTAQSPPSALACFTLGNLLARQGRMSEAEKSFRQGLEQRPGDPNALVNLGAVLQEQGRLDAAIESYKAAIDRDGTSPGPWNNLGNAWKLKGDLDQALNCYLSALELRPGDVNLRRNFASCLKNRALAIERPGFLAAVEQCLDTPGIDAQKLVPAALAGLRGREGFRILLEPPGDPATIEKAWRAGDLDRALDDRLFQTLLERTVLTDPITERLLTALRRSMLAASLEDDATAPRRIAQMTACALQAFNNEYIWSVSAAEEDRLARLRIMLTPLQINADNPQQVRIVAYALYRPLFELKGATRLVEADQESWHPRFRRLVKQQLSDRDREARLRAEVKPMTEVHDETSRAVREQYEQNPYPRWLSIDKPAARPAAAVLTSLFPHFEPPRCLGRRPRILVAGCGTGRHAISVAQRFSDAEILAIDFSAASLAYAARMAEDLEVDNIDFRQDDILSLEGVEERFEIVESLGVLHHLDDPIRGWRILVDLLASGGLMKIGLYSRTARVHLSAARDFIVSRGFDASPEGIRAAREALFALPADHPVAAATRGRDFYSLSACRDMLFHVREHCFDLPEIAAALAALGLDFLGFELYNPQARTTYRATYPEDRKMTDLDHWAAFETEHPHLFVGMYQFWCQKA